MVDSNRWGILYCPKTSLLSSPRKHWASVERVLKNEGIAYDFVQSEARGSVSRLVKMLINNGYKTIVIVGGDSALNDAVNCLMQTEKKVRDEIVLGIIPNGVMNDFAHFWNFKEGELVQNVKWLKQRRIRKIDVGFIRYKNRYGEACRRYFVNCVNLGYVANVMNLRRTTHHYLGSRMFSFIVSFILLFFQRLDYKMRLHINTDDINRRVMTVCIGNSTGYGQTPNAVPYNGLLDVSVVYPPATTQLFEGIYLFLKGRFLNHKSVHPYRTKEVRVEQANHVMVSVDGRLLNQPIAPYVVSVEQEVINFLIPA
jgi:diacylglycerol kinase family enzyme